MEYNIQWRICTVKEIIFIISKNQNMFDAPLVFTKNLGQINQNFNYILRGGTTNLLFGNNDDMHFSAPPFIIIIIIIW